VACRILDKKLTIGHDRIPPLPSKPIFQIYPLILCYVICSVEYEEEAKCIQSFGGENLKERGYLEDLGIAGIVMSRNRLRGHAIDLSG
jgi:hypothetical protein